jgi:Flp pilus assembly protein TadG
MRNPGRQAFEPVRRPRRGAAAVEMAILLPVLVFILVAATDFARVCRDFTIVTWSARDGALYGCTSTTTSTDTAGIQSAAQADASDLSPLPTISSTTGSDTDSKGSTYTYVEVTASYTFTTFARIPGIPSSVSLSRTVRMQVQP